jgi:hypothetical protein
MSRKNDACFECGQVGHWAADCPRKRRRAPMHARAGELVTYVPGTGKVRPAAGDFVQLTSGIMGVVKEVHADGTVSIEQQSKEMMPVLSTVFQPNEPQERPTTEPQWQQACKLWKHLLDVTRQPHQDVGLVMEAWLQNAVTRSEAVAMLAFLSYDARPIAEVKGYRANVNAIAINDGKTQTRLDRQSGYIVDVDMSPARIFVQGDVGQQLHDLGDALDQLEQDTTDE